MPNICFSYPADLPLSIRDHGAAAVGLPRRPAGKPYPCFSYSADDPPRDLRRMPYTCFSFSAGDLRRMPVAPCFSYPADLPSGVRKRN